MFLLMAAFLMFINPSLVTRTIQISIPSIDSNFPECMGSLVVETTEGEEKRFTVSKKNTRLRAKTVRVEGCGCFYLYQRPRFRATSRFISPQMKRVSGDNIGFRIRSIEKVSCDENI